jgi:zinc protease
MYSQKDPKTLKFPDIEFAPKKPGLAAIKEGVTFYFQEDYESPVIEGMLIFKSGSLYEPSGKEGLASLTMRMLKAGGTASLTPDNLEDKLDFLGSTIDSSVLGSTIDSSGRLEFSQIRFWTLKKNFHETWRILIDMLYNPGFDVDRFETEKKKDLENIRRRFDFPSSLGMFLFMELIYGKDFPEARRTTSSSINGITLDDVKAFYENNIRNSEVIGAFAGDFEQQEMLSLIKESFEDWKVAESADLDLPKAALATRPGVYFIDKPEMTQAIITLGHLGLNNHDKDNVEVNVFNFILGDPMNWNSRLMREVRSNRGLAYNPFGLISLGRDKGIFYNFCQSKSQSVGEAIKLMRDIITDMTENPVTPEELEIAKKYEVNSFVHKFDSPWAVVRQAVYLKLEGYPDDFLETYIPRIKMVNADKVLAIGKRAVNPDKMVILVVGKKTEVLDQLKALGLGEVTELLLPKE